MEEFIKQLLRDKGVPDSLDSEVRAQLERDLTDRAVDMINRRLVESLSETDVEELNSLLDNDPDNTQAMQQFIETKVPDRDALAAQALLEFRTLYLGSSA